MSALSPQEILRDARHAYDAAHELDLIAAIRLAAGPGSGQQERAAGAMHLLYASIYRHECVGNVARALARWESIRTRAEVCRALALAAEDGDAVRELDDRHEVEMADTEAALEQMAERLERGGLDEH